MKYLLKLTDGSELEVTERDYGSIARLVNNQVHRGITLQNGNILSSQAIMYMHTEGKPEPVAVPEVAVEADEKKVETSKAPSSRTIK